MTRVAAVQLSSGADVSANLDATDEQLAAAAAEGCGVAVLPENFALMPERGRDKAAHAEAPGDGPIQAFLAAAAERHGLWIVGGSLPLESPQSGRVYGACVVVDDAGETRAIYRKIHLFDVDLPDSTGSYRESNSMYPGDALATVDSPIGTIGLTICYDVRFPELFRALVDKGATAFTVPAAFTVVTGKAHWHTLLRARAIENLAWVIAPGQVGTHPDGRATFGHSLIIDPWGRIVAESGDGTGIVVADIDTDTATKLRADFPALSNRRLTDLERTAP
ncbi:MAG: carbon-nitrogen hydrolase family protein [Woeseiaceae bacterium]|nr:carbon-nitrogen hydrolase family protein [Woeseiaceae bacterium]